MHGVLLYVDSSNLGIVRLYHNDKMKVILISIKIGIQPIYKV